MEQVPKFQVLIRINIQLLCSQDKFVVHGILTPVWKGRERYEDVVCHL